MTATEYDGYMMAKCLRHDGEMASNGVLFCFVRVFTIAMTQLILDEQVYTI